MGETFQREKDLILDIECGGTTSEEDVPNEAVSGISQARKLFGLMWNSSMSFDGPGKGEGDLVSSSYRELNSDENVGSALEKNLGGEAKAGNDVKRETPKKKSNKKHPKPPRPPKSPLLDVSDQKLVKEIAELAMLKRARIERMKALKKMRAAKASSSSGSSSNLCAMVITLLFCVIIVFQGALSRNHSKSDFQGSTHSQKTARGLVSSKYYKNSLKGGIDYPVVGSQSHNGAREEVPGLSNHEGRRNPTTKKT